MSMAHRPPGNRRSFLAGVLRILPVAAVVAAACGCGDSNGTSSVMPTDPKDFPENRAKASIDFMRQQRAKKKK